MLSKLCVSKRKAMMTTEGRREAGERNYGGQMFHRSGRKYVWSTLILSAVVVSLEDDEKKLKKAIHADELNLTLQVSPKVYQVRAGILSRLGAFILSWAVWVGVSFFVGPVVYGIPLVIDLLLSYRSQDLGKYLSGQVVVDKVTGEPASLVRMILRYLVKLGLTTVLLADYVLWPVLGDPIHDALLGTTVVYEMED